MPTEGWLTAINYYSVGEMGQINTSFPDVRPVAAKPPS